LFNLQQRYAVADGQLTMLIFLVVLRYKAFPEAQRLINGYPHDFCDFELLFASVQSFYQSDDMAREAHLLIECASKAVPFDLSKSGYCYASAVTPEISDLVASLPYDAGRHPVNRAKSGGKKSSGKQATRAKFESDDDGDDKDDYLNFYNIRPLTPVEQKEKKIVDMLPDDDQKPG